VRRLAEAIGVPDDVDARVLAVLSFAASASSLGDSAARSAERSKSK
jgi:hypothetical protein